MKIFRFRKENPLTGIRLSELSKIISTYADNTRVPVPSCNNA